MINLSEVFPDDFTLSCPECRRTYDGHQIQMMIIILESGYRKRGFKYTFFVAGPNSTDMLQSIIREQFLRSCYICRLMGGPDTWVAITMIANCVK